MTSARPQFPMWIFIATDLALLSAAAVIALQAEKPLSQANILWIVGCAALGVFVGLVPLIWHYERQKNEALDDRQRALEALARTVSSSADQISIATGGLHDIAELAQKNLRHADQLPQRLQEKMAEFQSQLAQANDTDKEELERELLALRTTESERLDAVSQRIAKASAEWAKLEAATAQHLAAANEGLAKLSLGTASAIGKAQVSAEQALAQARTEAARTVGEASGKAVKAIETAQAAALAEIAAKLTPLVERLADEMAMRFAARLRDSSAIVDESAVSAQSAARQPAPSLAPALPAPEPAATIPSAIESANSAGAASAPAQLADSAPPNEAAVADPTGPVRSSEPPAVSVKRSRKPRREGAAPADAAAAPAASAPEIAPGKAGESAPAILAQSGETAVTENSIPQESPPAPSEAPKTPVAPAPTAPSPEEIANPQMTSPAEPPPSTPQPLTKPPQEGSAPANGAETAKPAVRKRPARKSAENETPALDLDLNDAGPIGASNGTERVRTSDGATRLLVTAYIGIGNRLFIRGDGPGLNWNKGTPLEFVSIGKWRWETNDATQPVEFMLYKNDDIASSTLGKVSIEPGHQQEVTAAF